MAEPRKNNGRRRVSRGSNPVEPSTLEHKLRLVLKTDVAVNRLDDVVAKVITVINSETPSPVQRERGQ